MFRRNSRREKCRVITPKEYAEQNCTKEAIEEHHITYYPEATTLMCSEHHEQIPKEFPKGITAQVNLKAIKQLVDIEKRCDITPSKETILKKLTPSVLSLSFIEFFSAIWAYYEKMECMTF